MKYIKTFEDLKNNDELNIGEYVICTDDLDYYDDEKTYNDYINFLKNNIGRFLGKSKDIVYCYNIIYRNVPTNIIEYFDELKSKSMDIPPDAQLLRANRKDILYHSLDKKELEIMINQNKFNL